MQKIIDGFNSEVNNIKEYVKFLEENIIANSISTRNINEIFKNLSSLRCNSNDEIKYINDILKNLEVEELPQWFKDIDVRSNEGGIIDYILETINDGDKDDIEEIMESIKEELELQCMMFGETEDGDFLCTLHNDEEKLKEFISLSKVLHLNNTYFDYKHRLEQLNNYNKALNLIDTKNNTNIYRQAFVQLIFVFDSVIFDVIRYKFNEDFFRWVNFFKKDDTIKLKDIGNNENFEEFRSMVIEKQLKNCYIKDLIDILYNNYKDVFIIDNKDAYVDFREIINRRNCHIHNNGIIDNSYLGINKINSNPQYNKYNFQLGEYAEIDKKYFENTLYYCNKLIENLI